ncbi:tricarballylate utilization 4Fe-4S protein TcuB [Rhodomicrobium sp. Az07]|uniref:tricarballylate utilization 4Fe-4S protein TcuB n=1 Tax=Rhodomicrobium sp. Az07 TaxID=2839034 RepID=UPI001BE9EBFE|nr:tricarballylate utilization 4Fe-4S protein TcuB [Rhodomicrobium sp. Az07]MBT3070408.1 tricarballylate utilization 4Fe-4S protein TcuB [Rhodomicrobium sp. Az07]
MRSPDAPSPERLAPLAEAGRVATICAVCNYCNGFCEAMRAIEQRGQSPRPSIADNGAGKTGVAPAFSDGDIAYIAHLCHNCGNCLTSCQYAPPHVFAVDAPKALADVRALSWRERPWLALAIFVAVMVLTVALVPWGMLTARHAGEGAFYAVIPWATMTAATLAPFLFGIALVGIRVTRFWRAISGGDDAPMAGSAWRAIPLAIRDAATLRNLEGGGIPCEQSAARRFFHHALAYGFLLCFAATCTATVYHHGFGWLAPYPLLSLPVILGTVGGVGMVIGAAGLAGVRTGGGAAFDTTGDFILLTQLFAVAASGLALLALRDTPAMGVLLAVHLGTVLGFFATLPFGRFAHAPYRAAALLKAAMERRR